MIVRMPRLFVVVLVGLCVPATSTVGANASAATAPCVSPEWKQMNFWVGDWDVSWPGGSGSNHVTKILGGCVVEENFSGDSSRPLHGLSVSTYDPSSKRWKQTWVDDRGSYIDLAGGLVNGEMTLGRETTKPDGKSIRVRMVFKNVQANAFDWSWERSDDGGTTWTVQWPIHYTRKRP